MTNEQWIKSLDTEELAKFVRLEILDFLDCWEWNDDDERICKQTCNECQFACSEQVKKWLKQEREE